MSLEINRNVVNWYVFFQPRRAGHPWWMSLLDRRFAHCFAVGDFDGLPVMANHLACHTVIEPMQGATMGDVLSNNAPHCSAILAVTVEYTRHRVPHLWGYLSCVSLLRGVLAISAPCWTPKQLYNRVRNYDNGCVVIKPLGDDMDFLKPKKPDTKYQEKQSLLQAQQERRLQEQEQKLSAKDSASRRASVTNTGSLLSGMETGVPPVTGRRTVG